MQLAKSNDAREPALAGAWRLPHLAEVEAALSALALRAIKRNLSSAAATDN
jgi:hypothetical protein